jgi:hypothetical protein
MDAQTKEFFAYRIAAVGLDSRAMSHHHRKDHHGRFVCGLRSLALSVCGLCSLVLSVRACVQVLFARFVGACLRVLFARVFCQRVRACGFCSLFCRCVRAGVGAAL